MDLQDEIFEENVSEGSDEFIDENSLVNYDETIEPVANEEEAGQYVEDKQREDEEEQRLLARFSGELELKEWCMCGNCNLENALKAEECRCCMEYDRCTEKMEAIELEGQCITNHLAFNSVCLDKWVLDVAGISFKKRDKASYNSARKSDSDAEYFRSVAYRQFVRFVWQYVGGGNRIALPCCVYNKIRREFPSTTQQYTGFNEEDDVEEESSESNSDKDTDSDDEAVLSDGDCET